MNYNHHKIPSNCNRRDALIERKQHISRFNGIFFSLVRRILAKNLSNNFDTLLSETRGTHDRNKHFRGKFFRH